MQIQFNTDNNTSGNESSRTYFIALISDELKEFSNHITRIELHLTDENGNKNGQNDKKCLIEARIEGRQPIAVANHADTEELAIGGAIDKLKNSLDTLLGKSRHH